MNAENKTNLEFLILSIYQEMGETYVRSICPQAQGGAGDLQLMGREVHVETLAGDPRVNPSWEDRLASADGMLLLVRFMDVISMDKVKAIFRSIPQDFDAPMVIALFREAGESDFKMSCAACGQKLWVRDQDIGKRGRCPNCKRAFRLPAQDEHLRSQLLVPDAVSVMTVDRGSPEACLAGVGALVERLGGELVPSEEVFDPDVLKQQTMRIQVSTGDTKPGETSAGDKPPPA
jgi:hypothetical protein